MVFGKCFEGIFPCFLCVIRLNILRFDSKKGGEPIFVNIRIKNEKGI